MYNIERISKELLGEDAAIWFTEQLGDLVVLIKAPINSCKSLANGCQAEFFIGKDKTLENPIIHSCIRIYDDEINPVIISGAHRFNEENNALIKTLKSESCLVSLYNELGILVATGQIVFNKIDRFKALHMIGSEKTLYSGEFNSEVTRSLDSFDYTIDNSRQFDNPYIIDLVSLNCEFKNWKYIDTHFVGLIEQPKMRIDDKEEGATLEKLVWFSIENLFPFAIYLNPKFKSNKIAKELTDILAFHDLGIFLIETKGLSVFSQAKAKSMDKKVATLQKHITKAIKQLIGANENIKKGTEFFDSNDEKIEFKRNIVPHCVVLVSEILHFGDWEDIEKVILEAMCEAKIYLNVMDFREFMILVKNSKGKKEYLDYFLMSRAEKFVEVGSIHLRTLIIGGNTS